MRNTSDANYLSFSPKVDIAIENNSSNLAIGDINGDSKPDKAVTIYADNSVSVFRNTSTIGTISTASFASKVNFETGSGPRSISIRDIDADSVPDMFRLT